MGGIFIVHGARDILILSLYRRRQHSLTYIYMQARRNGDDVMQCTHGIPFRV